MHAPPHSSGSWGQGWRTRLLARQALPLIHRYRHRLQALFKKYTAYDPPPTRGHLSLKGFAKLLQGTGLYTVASLTPKTVALTLALALALPTDHADPDPSHNPNRDPGPGPDPIPKP